MVQAILDDRKTQTRRVIRPVPDNVEGDRPCVYYNRVGNDLVMPVQCRYQVGDRLWVRETWRVNKCYDGLKVAAVHTAMGGDVEGCISYRADVNGPTGWPGKWRPSIFMPMWACRLWLEVVSVGVERVRDISESDAQAEGCATAFPAGGGTPNYRRGYERLWDSLHAKRGVGWQQNPWVWVITFKRTEGGQS